MNNTVMTAMRNSADRTVTGEERPGHPVLRDLVTELYDCPSTSTLDSAVRPKCDMDAEEPIDIVIEKDAVRPKSDMDAVGAAAKKTPEDKDEVSNEDVEFRRLTEVRRNIPKGEKKHLKELSKQRRKCIRDEKRSRRQEKIQRILEECRGIKNISGIKSARKRVLIPKVKSKTTKARQSHRETGLQMSSANSTANFLKAMKMKRSFTKPLSHDTRSVYDEKSMETITIKKNP